MVMVKHMTGMFSTANAVVRSEVVRDPYNTRGAICTTGVTYAWSEAPMYGKTRKAGTRELSPVDVSLYAGDRLALRSAWDVMFDYVVQVQMNSPRSMVWNVVFRGVDDAWVLGAAQALVEVIALEVGVLLRVRREVSGALRHG